MVKCGSDGAIDLGDLRAKLEAHAAQVAAIMVTYPSTNGVFEETVSEVCDAVHEHGGQVYIDGANLNALVGLATPVSFGADVSHLNLHKTFCIPHGGGGPGIGPMAVRAHLAEFLPGHPQRATPWVRSRRRRGARAGILPISWAYIAMMGADGLRRATQVAMLSRELRRPPARPALPGALHRPRGPGRARVHPGPAADHGPDRDHGRGRRQAPGRLRVPRAHDVLPGGGHADGRADRKRGPDRARPVLRGDDRHPAGDRAGRQRRLADRDDNPLKNAPHTAETLLTAEWKHPYERSEAAYPVPSDRRAKYWPPVRRIDQAYGDRNLVCACPPPQAFE